MTPAINSVGLYWPEGSNFEHSLLTGQTVKSHLTQLVFLATHGSLYKTEKERYERYTFIARLFGTGEKENYKTIKDSCLSVY